MGTLWEIDAEAPAVFQRADFPAIYEDPVAAVEVLPGAFSVERDASGSHTDMMPTIGPQILNSDGTLVGQIGTKAAFECVTDGASAFLCWLDIGAAAGDSHAGHSDEEYL